MKQVTTNNPQKFIICDDEDYELLSSFKWSISRGYALYCKDNKVESCHRLLTNCPKGLQVDHINGNRLDNRRENLRIVTSQQNNMNRSIGKNNTSGYKGVTYKTRDKKFAAQIKLNGKIKSLGHFHTAIEANQVYQAKALELFGEYNKQ
jgi:hypothetical protein